MKIKLTESQYKRLIMEQIPIVNKGDGTIEYDGNTYVLKTDSLFSVTVPINSYEEIKLDDGTIDGAEFTVTHPLSGERIGEKIKEENRLNILQKLKQKLKSIKLSIKNKEGEDIELKLVCITCGEST